MHTSSTNILFLIRWPNLMSAHPLQLDLLPLSGCLGVLMGISGRSFRRTQVIVSQLDLSKRPSVEIRSRLNSSAENWLLRVLLE